MPFPPASVNSNTNTLAHINQLIYRKAALDRLRKKRVFHEVCVMDRISKRSGQTVQFYRWTSPTAAVLTPTPEGTQTQNGGSFQSRVLNATVSQYADAISFSDYVLDTGPDDLVQHHSELLGEQAGLAVDTMIRTTLDSGTGAQLTQFAGAGNPLALEDIRAARHILQAKDVTYLDKDGHFRVFASPYTTFDIVNNPNSGEFADVVKHVYPRESALVTYEDRGLVMTMSQCKVFETTNTKVTAGTPNLYRTYIIGQGAIGTVDLEGRGPDYIKDPSKQAFKIMVKTNLEADAFNQEGKIGGFVSYNFIHTSLLLDGVPSIGGTYRYAWWDAQSVIG